MATPRHVAIFLPQETPFYRALLAQMRRGFEAEGVETSGLCRHLGADEMATWCASHHPQVILEMNRSRREAEFIPRDVHHVAWIVDFHGRPLEHFEGSEITYLFGVTWPERYPHRGFFRWFGPGACEHDYPFATREPEVDVSFAGFIPRPFTEAERARDLTGGQGRFTLGDLLPQLEARLRAARDRLRTVDDFFAIAADIAREQGAGPLVLDDRLKHQISGRTIRQLNRRDMLDAALARTDQLTLYGPDTWLQWPRYAPHYRGFLEDPAELCRVYQSARATLHEGNGIHFRSMDCMSAGGLLFFRETAHDGKPGGIRSFFEPDVHYVPFTLETLGEQLSRYLSDPLASARIRRQAADAIRARHTWRHRAREVLRDLRDV